MRRASPEVRPFTDLSTSAFALPCSVRACVSEPPTPYLLGLASDCIMRIASASSTVSSQFVSPFFVGTISCVEVVTGGTADVVEVVVVVVVVVVLVEVDVVVIGGSGPGVLSALSTKLMFHAKEACQSGARSLVLHEATESA